MKVRITFPLLIHSKFEPAFLLGPFITSCIRPLFLQEMYRSQRKKG